MRAVLSTVLALVVLGTLTVASACRGRGGATTEEESESADEASTAAPADTAVSADRQVVLFFPSPNDELLHGETRTVLPIAAPEERAKQCLEELIRGPQPPLLAAVPDRVRVRQIYLLSDGTAFIDFSSEMLAHRGGSLGELQTIYAIVDTLTANVREIRRVGILVDGRSRETLSGHVDISEPLTADYKYVDPASRSSIPETAAGSPADGGAAGASGASGAEGDVHGSRPTTDAGQAGAGAARDGTTGDGDASRESGDGRP